eukprot:8755698-Pyramimonas_sp.AAC.1
MDQGFVASRAAEATCFEVNPNSKQHQIDFNVRLCREADGLLAPVQARDISGLSVSATHTNCGLSAWISK